MSLLSRTDSSSDHLIALHDHTDLPARLNRVGVCHAIESIGDTFEIFDSPDVIFK